MNNPNFRQEPSPSILQGYLDEKEIADQRGKTTRTLRSERQRGDGPPFVKDGKKILYPVEGFREWLRGRENHPVRGSSR